MLFLDWGYNNNFSDQVTEVFSDYSIAKLKETRK